MQHFATIPLTPPIADTCIGVTACSRSNASQKAELIRAISLSSSMSDLTRKDSDLGAAEILCRGATAVTTPAADDPMNCTLEDLIVKNLDRDSAASSTATVVRGIRALSTPDKQRSPSGPAARRASNSPDTNEASPGDSDYESESNGIPLLKVRTPAKMPPTARSSVDFNQTIKKSIKDLFMK